jgi:hypothetical protein
MRKLLFTSMMLAVIAVQSGCIVPIWSALPDKRVRQLIYTSENYRHIPEIWERTWFLDQPDFETPYRTHGGII